MENLFENLEPNAANELIQVLARTEQVRIERIVSQGQVTPAGQWYDQPESEWVLVVRGFARIAFEDGSSKDLKEGDFLLIPPHRRHRVSYTTPNEPTIWLAVFFSDHSVEF